MCAAAYLVCPQVGVVFFAVFVVSVLGHVPGAKVEKFQTEIITLPGGRPDWFNNAGSYYYFTPATTSAVLLLPPPECSGSASLGFSFIKSASLCSGSATLHLLLPMLLLLGVHLQSCLPCNQMVCRLALRGDTLRGSAARLNNSRVSSSWNSSSLLQSHSMWTLPLPKVSGADTNGYILLLLQFNLSSSFVYRGFLLMPAQIIDWCSSKSCNKRLCHYTCANNRLAYTPRGAWHATSSSLHGRLLRPERTPN